MFEGQINYTTVSRLKLCQIERSHIGLTHTVSRSRRSEHPFVKILVSDVRYLILTGWLPHRADARRLSRL